MGKSPLIGALCAAVSSFIAMPAHSALIDQGGGLIYDPDLNITWLANANAGAGSVYDDGISSVDGQMSWQNAMDWAADLTYYDSVRDVTYSDWRLASMDVNGNNMIVECGGVTGCIDNEYGHLYNEEGITDSSFSPFSNVQSGVYWSNTVYALHPDSAWGHYFNGGNQATGVKTRTDFYAWAVRSGNVAAVPVPATLWLFGSGLIGLIGIARKKRLN